MSKFKVGDKVRRVRHKINFEQDSGLDSDAIHTVCNVKNGWIDLAGQNISSSGRFDPDYFELVTDTMTLEEQIIKAKSLIGKTVKDKTGEGKEYMIASWSLITRSNEFVNSDSVWDYFRENKGCVGVIALTTNNDEEFPVVGAVEVPFNEKAEYELNDSYTATIFNDGNIIVGCQTFNINQLKEMIKLFEGLDKP